MKLYKQHITYSLIVAFSLVFASCTSYESLLAVDDSHAGDGIYSNKTSGYGYIDTYKKQNINNIAGDPSLGLYDEVDESYNAYLENNYFNGNPEEQYVATDSAETKDMYYSEENRSSTPVSSAYNSGFDNYYSPFRFNISMMFGYGGYPYYNPYFNPYFNPYYSAFYDPFNNWMYPGFGWGYPSYAWGPGGIYYPPHFINDSRPRYVNEKRNSRTRTAYDTNIKYEYKKNSRPASRDYSNKSTKQKSDSGYYNKYRSNDNSRRNSSYDQYNRSNNYNNNRSYTPSNTRSNSSSGNTNSSSNVRRSRR